MTEGRRGVKVTLRIPLNKNKFAMNKYLWDGIVSVDFDHYTWVIFFTL